MIRHGRLLASIFTFAACTIIPADLFAQTFGTELQNVLMPASGGMAGVSISRPQDVVSAINANPASLRQFEGTQFIFGGAWAEPTFNMSQTAPIPLLGVEPFSGKSTAQGSGSSSIGVSQNLDWVLGLPITFGAGFVTAAGGAADFRQFPESNGTNAAFTVFETPLSIGIDITERWSVGAGMSLGIALFDGPFVGLGGMTSDYALRGVFGTNYLVGDATSIGCYYQSLQSFRFDHAVQFTLGPDTRVQDIRMDLPQNIGIGFADSQLCDGNLLLAADIVYKLWDEADLYRSIYNNQWVFQFGTQYNLGRYLLRSGYAYAENPVDPLPIDNVGGVLPPGGPPSIRYTQGLLAVANPHRISAGIGIPNMLPGIDLDLMAGGMFKDTTQLGPSTSVTAASYWVGFGMTWRFGACGHAGHTAKNSTPDFADATAYDNF